MESYIKGLQVCSVGVFFFQAIFYLFIYLFIYFLSCIVFSFFHQNVLRDGTKEWDQRL